MKLYQAPNYSLVRITDKNDGLDLMGPPGTRGFKAGDVLFFHRVDGMYSHCKDSEGNIVHLKAWVDVDLVPTALAAS